MILYHIVIVLLCLVILTFSMVSNRFARYSSGDLNSKWADVASFDVNITYGDVVDNDLTKQYPFTVTNESEVLVGFDKLVVEFKDPLAKKITLVLTDKNGTPLCEEQESDGKQTVFEFLHSATLPAYTSDHFRLQLTQNEREIFEEYDYTARLLVSVYQKD